MSIFSFFKTFFRTDNTRTEQEHAEQDLEFLENFNGQLIDKKDYKVFVYEVENKKRKRSARKNERKKNKGEKKLKQEKINKKEEEESTESESRKRIKVDQSVIGKENQTRAGQKNPEDIAEKISAVKNESNTEQKDTIQNHESETQNQKKSKNSIQHEITDKKIEIVQDQVKKEIKNETPERTSNTEKKEEQKTLKKKVDFDYHGIVDFWKLFREDKIEDWGTYSDKHAKIKTMWNDFFVYRKWIAKEHAKIYGRNSEIFVYLKRIGVPTTKRRVYQLHDHMHRTNADDSEGQKTECIKCLEKLYSRRFVREIKKDIRRGLNKIKHFLYCFKSEPHRRVKKGYYNTISEIQRIFDISRTQFGCPYHGKDELGEKLKYFNDRLPYYRDEPPEYKDTPVDQNIEPSQPENYFEFSQSIREKAGKDFVLENKMLVNDDKRLLPINFVGEIEYVNNEPIKYFPVSNCIETCPLVGPLFYLFQRYGWPTGRDSNETIEFVRNSETCKMLECGCEYSVKKTQIQYEFCGVDEAEIKRIKVENDHLRQRLSEVKQKYMTRSEYLQNEGNEDRTDSLIKDQDSYFNLSKKQNMEHTYQGEQKLSEPDQKDFNTVSTNTKRKASMSSPMNMVSSKDEITSIDSRRVAQLKQETAPQLFSPTISHHNNSENAQNKQIDMPNPQIQNKQDTNRSEFQVPSNTIQHNTPQDIIFSKEKSIGPYDLGNSASSINQDSMENEMHTPYSEKRIRNTEYDTTDPFALKNIAFISPDPQISDVNSSAHNPHNSVFLRNRFNGENHESYQVTNQPNELFNENIFEKTPIDYLSHGFKAPDPSLNADTQNNDLFSIGQEKPYNTQVGDEVITINPSENDNGLDLDKFEALFKSGSGWSSFNKE